MANLCLSILVLTCFQIVFANICSKEYNTHESCDECIRCGGSWCHENMGPDRHCMRAPGDNWCPAGSKETLRSIHPIYDIKDSQLAPSYSERTLIPGSVDKLSLRYKSKVELEETFTILNTTQTEYLESNTIKNYCDENSSCSLIIEVLTLPDFCLRQGSTDEVVHVVVTLPGDIEAAVKYHVPCACECSKETKKKSPKCNGNGDLTCGACMCYKGAFGDFCDQCPEQEGGRRGDLRCSPEHDTKTTCSGNGYCGPCETCICYPVGEGSQYFDHTNYCADICTTIQNISPECEACLKNGTLGPCPNECQNVTIQKYNETISEERDDFNRRIWARCNETVDQCYLEYVAMKHESNNSIVVMVNESCNNILGADAYVTTKVPLIIGVLGLVAAVAAVGGVMLWKHMNTVPPLPLTDPKYENIDAEDCIGENPLYKPPTSSFKNPTYGKW